MESGGGRLNIKISPDPEGKCVDFEISDTGGGISDETSQDIRTILQPKKPDRTRPRAIVHKIVEIHNSTIGSRVKRGRRNEIYGKITKEAEELATESTRRSLRKKSYTRKRSFDVPLFCGYFFT